MDVLHIATGIWIAWILFGTGVTIFQVGKPREPISGGVAVLSTLLNALLILTLLAWMEVV